ncbi:MULTISPECIES: NUDIX hydrolase [Maribacter]|uniref:NUDIX domain-containing protein n=1 Tax=Maribacter flavus TaxID=1658664 RepID=A0ABU7IJR9_9FLAO|nr:MULTISPECIES: NUDIX domain-containing protein [Maribacter]MDC6406006.1 NUDIX domain-containing protein [Maribacter sp. PR66]MEE1973209.1 NUDIX domain-containing protein [Maribacter flavus]
MDELIDILDADGNLTGQSCMKSEAHRDGLFHPTVHIWIYTSDGEVLLQQRGKDKDTHPLLWDVSVAGHVGASEDLEKSAVREVAEEIGLIIRPSDLQKIGVFKSVQKHSVRLIDCEFHHTFMCELKEPIENLKKQESEVEALDSIPISQFKKEVLDTMPDKYVPHKKEYYETILKALKSKLIGNR